MGNNKEKECNKCHQIKPLSEFVKDEAFKEGYRPECKEYKYKRLKKLTEKLSKISIQTILYLLLVH